jgi:hypothetical protein
VINCLLLTNKSKFDFEFSNSCVSEMSSSAHRTTTADLEALTIEYSSALIFNRVGFRFLSADIDEKNGDVEVFVGNSIEREYENED